jgi:hypothetical protein
MKNVISHNIVFKGEYYNLAQFNFNAGRYFISRWANSSMKHFDMTTFGRPNYTYEIQNYMKLWENCPGIDLDKFINGMVGQNVCKLMEAK